MFIGKLIKSYLLLEEFRIHPIPFLILLGDSLVENGKTEEVFFFRDIQTHLSS